MYLVRQTVFKLPYIWCVDVLVNNAGVFLSKGFMEHTMEDFDFLMDTNIKAVVNISQVY